MDEVPKSMQSYNYSPPKKKESKVKKEMVAKEKAKIKKSTSAMKVREKENKTMKTLTFPGYRK